jgi:hypothetical protein
MPTLADIYSLIDSTKRRGADFIQNPGASLQQMVGYANDRAGDLNRLTYEATDEGMGFGPKTRELAGKLAESYNPMGMTAKVTPLAQIGVDPVEKRAWDAINEFTKNARYLGVGSPDYQSYKLPLGHTMALMNENFGMNTQVSALDEAKKARLRQLWNEIEQSGLAYKRVHGENKFFGRMPEVANEQSYKPKFLIKKTELKKMLKSGEIDQAKYDRLMADHDL